ncbi:uncharacterized protein LOC122060981 [Macadamia integrifolia]|uniref:uncharacterized protein LOC122060981 n=1 Tax=Macadamia integrifolia TaxID=60698 RepID=UPI001C52DB6F|nr:uncharacterized protein LOC122060981 [Macadamia integrifolia]
MLGVLRARPKSWIFSTLSLLHPIVNPRIVASPISFVSGGDLSRRYNHSTECRLRSVDDGARAAAGAASIWHAILPSGGGDRRKFDHFKLGIHHEQKGEGSWNVALDVRPARWLYRSDSAWLLFGVCPCLSSSSDCCGGNLWAAVEESVVATDEIRLESIDKCSVDSDNQRVIGAFSADSNGHSVTDAFSADSDGYRVTGVNADGRCLFRAISHGACLRSGEEAPDETRQKELADDLRARVADELLKRREETEWFIEGDFDMYVKSIQQPNAWGGEPELLMASHVLRIPISVFMKEKSSGRLTNIASYGEEYEKDKQSPVKVLFHRYGHYDLLETF